MKILLFYLFILVAGFLALGFMHEQVHVAIYEKYNIESHVEYFSHFPNFVTIAEEPCPNDTCINAHLMNEVLGYPLMVLYCVFGLFFFFLLSYKEEEARREDYKIDLMKKGRN